MSVERRYSARHPVDLPVHVRYRKRRLHGARAGNLSSEGMFLDVQSITVPRGTLVELEIDNHGTERRIPALVIHRQGSGIGVMFRDPQPGLMEDLIRLSRTPGPEARSRFAATSQGHPASSAG